MNSNQIVIGILKAFGVLFFLFCVVKANQPLFEADPVAEEIRETTEILERFNQRP
jgi:hypothetical protein